MEVAQEIMTALWAANVRPDQHTQQEVAVDKIVEWQEKLTEAGRQVEYERGLRQAAEERLDKALELLGMESPKRRVTVRRGGNGDGESEET